MVYTGYPAMSSGHARAVLGRGCGMHREQLKDVYGLDIKLIIEHCLLTKFSQITSFVIYKIAAIRSFSELKISDVADFRNYYIMRF